MPATASSARKRVLARLLRRGLSSFDRIELMFTRRTLDDLLPGVSLRSRSVVETLLSPWLAPGVRRDRTTLLRDFLSTFSRPDVLGSMKLPDLIELRCYFCFLVKQCEKREHVRRRLIWAAVGKTDVVIAKIAARKFSETNLNDHDIFKLLAIALNSQRCRDEMGSFAVKVFPLFARQVRRDGLLTTIIDALDSDHANVRSAILRWLNLSWKDLNPTKEEMIRVFLSLYGDSTSTRGFDEDYEVIKLIGHAFPLFCDLQDENETLFREWMLDSLKMLLHAHDEKCIRRVHYHVMCKLYRLR